MRGDAEGEAAIRAALDQLAGAILAAIRAQAPSAEAPDRLLGVEEARQLLGGVGRTTIYALLSSGRLRSVKVGRRRLIPSSALSALATGNPQ